MKLEAVDMIYSYLYNILTRFHSCSNLTSYLFYEMKRHGNESNENMAFRRDDLHMQTSPCQNHFKV